MGNRRLGRKRLYALNKLGQTNANAAGAGIRDAIVSNTVRREGHKVITEITVDLGTSKADIESKDTELDIIGVDGTALYCNIGQITAALNGTIFGGTMECIETPAGGEPDIDLYAAAEATGTEDSAIGDLTETALVTAGQDWASTHDDTASVVQKMGLIAGAVPDADEYLYLVGGGGTTDADYSAGIFVITLYGYPA